MATTEWLIRGGRVFDGSGADSEMVDVWIKNGVIAVMGRQFGRPDPGVRVYDARGRWVCPGFVDAHSHSDVSLLSGNSSKTCQGITSEIVGNCGLSAAPVPARRFPPWIDKFVTIFGPAGRFRGGPLSRLIDLYRKIETPARPYFLTGLGAIRMSVIGDSARPARGDDLKQMKQILAESLDAGSVGFSYGPYVPAVYASIGELKALLDVVRRHGKLFAVHLPSEGDQILAALNWAIGLARSARVPLHISHLKICGLRNVPKFERVIRKIESAARRMPVSFDAYPYAVGATLLLAIVPPALVAAGSAAFLSRLRRNRAFFKMAARAILRHSADWENLFLLAGPGGIKPYGLPGAMRRWNGLSLAEISMELKVPPVESALRILAGAGTGVGMQIWAQSQSIVDAVMSHPLCVVGTDALAPPFPHPRATQTMIRVIERFVIQKKTWPIKSAVAKMSGQTARVFGLPVGILRPGGPADVVVIDPRRVRTDGSFDHPGPPSGVMAVWSSGRCLIR